MYGLSDNESRKEIGDRVLNIRSWDTNTIRIKGLENDQNYGRNQLEGVDERGWIRRNGKY